MTTSFQQQYLRNQDFIRSELACKRTNITNQTKPFNEPQPTLDIDKSKDNSEAQVKASKIIKIKERPDSIKRQTQSQVTTSQETSHVDAKAEEQTSDWFGWEITYVAGAGLKTMAYTLADLSVKIFNAFATAYSYLPSISTFLGSSKPSEEQASQLKDTTDIKPEAKRATSSIWLAWDIICYTAAITKTVVLTVKDISVWFFSKTYDFYSYLSEESQVNQTESENKEKAHKKINSDYRDPDDLQTVLNEYINDIEDKVSSDVFEDASNVVNILLEELQRPVTS